MEIQVHRQQKRKKKQWLKEYHKEKVTEIEDHNVFSLHPTSDKNFLTHDTGPNNKVGEEKLSWNGRDRSRSGT